MDLSRMMTQLITQENIKNSKMLIIEGMNRFSLPIRKNAMVHIYGGEETGKTTFAIDIIKKNPNLSFIYIDTYGNVKDIPDNAVLFRSNRETDIIQMLKELNKSDADCIILDSYSNVLSSEESWEASSYEIMAKTLEKIHNIISEKNAVFFLLNTTNSNGKAFNKNKYLDINSVCELELINCRYGENTIELIPRKAIVNGYVYDYELEEDI